MTEPAPMQLAQVGYEAYAEFREWKAYDGGPIPDWSEADEGVQLGWAMAAGAIRHAILTPPGRAAREH